MTPLKEARKGNITESMEQVAKDEGIPQDLLLELVAQGRVVVPLNPNHSPIHPVGIGEKLKTKLNVNIGSSKDFTRG